METVQQDVQKYVVEYLTNHPGRENELANALMVSVPLIQRWKEGQNLPHPAIARNIIDRLLDLIVEPHPQG